MANVMKALKDEMARVSRKEIKNISLPHRKQLAELKKAMAEQSAALARIEKKLGVAHLAAKEVPPAVSRAKGGKARFKPKAIKSLRRRLGLNQPRFARLVGVSLAALRSWEQGRSAPRASSQAALISAKGIKSREARQKLGIEAPGQRKRRKKSPARRMKTRPVSVAKVKKARKTRRSRPTRKTRKKK